LAISTRRVGDAGDDDTHHEIVYGGEKPERLDKVLAGALPEFSRARIQALIREGRVLVDETSAATPSLKLAPGARIRLAAPPPAPPEPAGEDIPLVIVYEDEDVIVIDKPVGLVVHPAGGHESGTLVNALIAHCGDSLSGIGGVARPGIVHRLDKDTSGLIVVAKNDKAHRALAAQFADHGRSGPLERAYLAIVWGVPDRPRFSIDAPIARGRHNREKMIVLRGRGPSGETSGREAVTHVQVLEPLGRPIPDLPGQDRETPDAAEPGEAALVRCELETGRTHQIRVHMAHIGHPLLGDALYGSGYRTKASRLPEGARMALERLNRQALHATLLGFEHPRTKRVMRFESQPPADFAQLLDALRHNSSHQVANGVAS
jgi:23S rRNA pseudouridine1911/1915/1917 synthase